AWAGQRRERGWHAEWAGLAVAGFPLRVAVRIDAPRLARPSGLEWSTGAATASASPADLTLVTVRAPGPHKLRWREGPAATVTAQSATAVVDVSAAGRLEDASLVANGVSVAAEGLAEPVALAALAVTVDPAATPPAGHEEVAATFSLTLQDLTLPPLPGLALDRQVALVEAEGRLMGAVPPGPPAEALAAWSAEGGTVELDRLAVDWPPMVLEADGTLALDPASQPLVALSARVRGYGELMDRLAAAGVVEHGAANAAKIVLSLLARPDAQGRPAIPLPITIQDGAFYLGPARVGTVPPLVLPGQR
ncbi:MAG: DUF2125 domain-containing protein, partial [Pseudomonadota bacterium]